MLHTWQRIITHYGLKEGIDITYSSEPNPLPSELRAAQDDTANPFPSTNPWHMVFNLQHSVYRQWADPSTILPEIARDELNRQLKTFHADKVNDSSPTITDDIFPQQLGNQHAGHKGRLQAISENHVPSPDQATPDGRCKP